LTICVTVRATFTFAASDVAAEQHLAAADALFGETGPPLGLTVVAVIRSALGRAGTAIGRPT
jgi:hypothetical protein